MAVAKDGTIYIADTLNHRVRVVATTGIIRTLAGSGTAAHAGDGKAAAAAALNSPAAVVLGPDGGVYIADTLNHVVRIVNVSSGIISGVAGSGTYGYSGDRSVPLLAKLGNPRGIAVSSDGTVYIADTSNNVIRRVGL